MSDSSHREPFAIAKDLAIAAKNASAKLRLGFGEAEWEDEGHRRPADLCRLPHPPR
jgi:hypothetical protein